MRKYRLVAKKGEGTFSEVLKAQNVKDGKYHAIKCMKNRFESIDQVNNLREIQALRRLSPHEHIITLEEVLYDQPTGRLALVFELMDANLYELIRGRRHYLNPNLIKSYMWQLMKSLDHMHKKGIFHRDIKPENILIESVNEIGKGLKLADFGSCRGIYSKQPYTEYISTRWYRAPECLLTDGYYGPEMDLWGAGCVMFEITSLYPLYPGSNEVDQINRIHKVLGTPSAEILNKFKSKGASHISFDFPSQKGIGIPQLIPHASPDAIDLMIKLIKYDASERITAREAMRHPYFKEVREAEQKQQAESKVTQANTLPTPSSNASVASNQPSIAQSNLPSANAGVKPLPSLVPSNAGTDPTISNFTKGNASHQGGDNQYYLMQKPTQGQGGNQNKHGNNSNLMNVTGTNGGGGTSSLPPIVSANNANNNTGKYADPKSARSNMPSNNNNTQKKRKKYRMNYAQQNSEGVMKAYGLQGMGGGGTGGTGVSNGTYGQYQGGTKNGGGYPNVGKKY
eukprot:gene11051-12043_t